MIKLLNARYKFLRIYLRDFKGSLFLKSKKNLKFLKYLVAKRLLRQERKKNRILRSVIRLNLSKRKTIAGRWGIKRGKRNYRKVIFINKQAFRHFYSNLKERQIKRYIDFASKSRESFWKVFFFYLELRLDVILYRLNFFKDLKEIQQWFKAGNYLIVNKKLIKNRNVRLHLGDNLKIPLSYKKEFLLGLLGRLKLRSSAYNTKRRPVNMIYFNLPPYIEGNYKILSFFIRKQPQIKDFFVPANINISVALSYYRF